MLREGVGLWVGLGDEAGAGDVGAGRSYGLDEQPATARPVTTATAMAREAWRRIVERVFMMALRRRTRIRSSTQGARGRTE